MIRPDSVEGQASWSDERYLFLFFKEIIDTEEKIFVKLAMFYTSSNNLLIQFNVNKSSRNFKDFI